MLLSFVLVAVFAFGQDQDELRRAHAQRRRCSKRSCSRAKA